MENKLNKIFIQFVAEGEIKDSKTLVSGYINETFLIETIGDNHPDYVLQKLNHQVFPNIPELMNNKVHVTEFLREKTKGAQVILKFFKTLDGLYYYQDAEGYYWNLMEFIPDSKVLETTQNQNQAQEAGLAFGNFIKLLDDYPVDSIYEIIKDFHKMSFRYQQFDEALLTAADDRKEKAAEWIQQVLESREAMQELERLNDSGDIPTRVTHNDTKLSNILFDKNDKALCIIDLDTLMPGIVHYDFGDSIRTICSAVSEDEPDLNLVQFNLDYYKAYKKGFLAELGNILSKKEIELLPLAAQTITFIMGLRILTDYLNGDVYYHIKYPEHNLHRASNQLTLVKRMAEGFGRVGVKS